MKSPLRPLRMTPDSAALLDRGGRPTLRELLGGLQYDAATGALRLNAERVTLQLAEADRILRRELVAALGEDEARIFLLRRGFRMGANDAAFVARSWPALDRGDAFTAGTRLHMFSGIVRVETVHNDFDFARGRFSAEFLWHNSVEASDTEPDRPAVHPVCWQQLGYACGYASHFFGALVVYKETACAGQGHRACRVVGRLATGWGDDDPDVILFRNRIVPAAPVERRVARLAGVTPEAADAVLLAPVLRHLEQAARLSLPCLIAGNGACGQEVAALHLARLSGRSEPPLRLHGSAGAEALRAAVAQLRKPRRKEAPLLLVEGIETLPLPAQADLARDLAEEDGLLRSGLVATSALPLGVLAQDLTPALWSRLAPLAVDLPALAERLRDLPVLAALRCDLLAARLGIERPELAAGAFDAILPPVAGLDGLDAVLTGCLVAALAEGVVDAGIVARVQARVAPPALPDDGTGWVAARIAAGGFSLAAHEARIRAIAVEQAGGNLSAAARLLGLTRAQLAYREKGQS